MITILLLAQLSLPQTPTLQDRLDHGLIIGSSAMSSVAIGLTLACTATGECVELNPVMRRVLGDGPTRAVVFKAGGQAIALYTAWRFLDGKTRTIALAALFALNTLDAVHDMRTMRQIQERRAGRVAVSLTVPIGLR